MRGSLARRLVLGSGELDKPLRAGQAVVASTVLLQTCHYVLVSFR